MGKEKSESRVLFGILVVLVGIILLSEQVGLVPAFGKYMWFVLSKFWPLALIFFGAKLLVSKNNIAGIIVLLLGFSFLSNTLLKLDFFSVLWPVIIIGIGVSLLFKKDTNEIKDVVNQDNFISDTVLFWGVDKKNTSKEFKGGEINVAFGGLQINLRDALVSKNGAKINVNCAFGGVEIIVPKNCRIKSKGSVLIGDWKTSLKEREITKPVLEITGGVLFGGVEIKD